MTIENDFTIVQSSDTTKFFDKLNTIYYLAWCPRFWLNDVKLSLSFVKFYDNFTVFIRILVGCFHVSMAGSFFTQSNLNEEQANIRLMFGPICPGTMFFYVFLVKHTDEIKRILYVLMVELKQQYSDPVLEKQMLQRISRYSICLCIVLYLGVVVNGFKAFIAVITKGENFITVIPAWPEVHDTSSIAGTVRVIVYLCWVIYGTMMAATLSIIVAMLIGTRYQFKNLQSYFYKLNDIFDEKHLSQEEKETKYEKAFKFGIQMHSLTLRCKNKQQDACKEIFALMTVLFSVILMAEIIDFLTVERNMSNIIANGTITLTTLVSLGFFMWNGGDITVEASNLPAAMYSSGWQYCYGRSSVRIRKLVVHAIDQAQRPVVYRALGIVDFSYEAYVSFVKAPYSMVSVFY